MSELSDYVQKQKKLLADNATVFNNIFHVPLKKYWDTLLGFDITRFDEEFIKSGDGQMSAAVEEKYGKAGVRVIRILLGQEAK